jgi:YidC/Oxa1 family membrane protein insertase
MILLAGIMIWYFQTNKPEIEPEQNTTEQVESTSNNSETITVVKKPTFENDSIKNVALTNKLGAFAQSAINGSEGISVIENELIKLSIDNKGGQIKEALLKNFKTHDSLPLYMIKDNNSSFNINFGTTYN